MGIELVERGSNYGVNLNNKMSALFYLSDEIDGHYAISRLTFPNDPDCSGLPEIIGIVHSKSIAIKKAEEYAKTYVTELEQRVNAA